ncbi:hypothetical protein TUM19329_09900 [Legionella antarctica]|uniref:Uncharacterized protein n=1 Tax=Legionella antarctica TaxID=2708020 RepID=A0A6F8T2H4_9GAMM|nr:hypothetical protein [Legionella antarctica]BCA94629.1 hypothetical protein TUM19329_09900 [Legionella antarctica]
MDNKLHGELTVEERNRIQSSLVEIYKEKINSSLNPLSSQPPSIGNLKEARDQRQSTISEVLKSPDLNLEDCQNLDKIAAHANINIGAVFWTQKKVF